MKRLISLLCTLALALTMAAPAMTASAANGDEGRVINIVYDDSGSMCVDGVLVDRWGQALYAMEVFATMLGEEDEMNVYRMSDSGRSPIEVEGDDPDRVNTLVSALGRTGNTPFDTVVNAARDLLAEDGEKQRWLVVLTDGVFQGSPSGGAEAKLAEYAGQGLQVIYLAIDSSANPGIIFQGDPAKGFYAYDAEDSDEVLERITEMANQIFQQQKMPEGHIDISGSTVTVDADIPLSQLLIFAQGEGITVGDMTLNGTDQKATQQHQVEVTDANTPPSYANGGTILADGLCGVVQTYTADAAPYPRGTWQFTCSDTSNLEIYYIAGAEIDCHLTYNGVEVKNDEKHYAGEYGIDMRFIDPTTGEELKSDLLDSAIFTAEVDNDGNVQTITTTPATLRLKEGEVVLNAWAELPGNVTVRSRHNYTVYPEPIALDITAQTPGQGYKLSALGDQAEPITITVANRATGERIGKEEWDAIGDTLSVTSGEQINWIVRKGSEVGTWLVWPDYVTDMSDTYTGDLTFTVKAEYEIGTQAASGAGTFDLYIAGYTAGELRLDITPPDEPIRLNDLGDTEGARVSVTYKDEYTGEFKPLTAEQAKLVEFTLEADALKWELTAGDEAGTWYLKPKDDVEVLLYSGDAVVVVVSGVLTEDVLVYQGSDSEELQVVALTLVEKIARIIVYIIGIAIFLFFLLGYLCKKKLRFRRMKPYVQNPETLERLFVNKKRVLWSYLLPWVAQRAVITCFVPSYHCTFANAKIVAAGGGGFRITNIQAYDSDRIRLNGKRVNPNSDRRKVYNHVTLSALNEGEDIVGKAHF